MLDQVRKLQVDGASYRDAVDHLLSTEFKTSRGRQRCFLQILLSASQLYLDYQTITKLAPRLRSVAFRARSENALIVNDDALSPEIELRSELEQKLALPITWQGFTPWNSFSSITGLHKLEDYAKSLQAHLPEIYAETILVEAHANSFLTNNSNTHLERLLIGLQHLGRHHIGFVLQALEWAANENCWE